MRRPAPDPGRRELIKLALVAPLAHWGAGLERAARLGPQSRDLESLAASAGRVLDTAGAPAAGVRLERAWDGPLCRSRVVNEGRRAARLAQVVLFDWRLRLPEQTRIYGEGFQMLSQTGGTLRAPLDLGAYSDAGHYRLPQPEDATVAYGLLTLEPPGSEAALLAFTSCRRFSGRFELRRDSLQIVLDTEGLELRPGQAWSLEELTFRSGPDRAALLAALAERLGVNHAPLAGGVPPAGWCSWYCFGPRVTAEQVLANLETIRSDLPGLRYVQIDDGYQPAMGDWLLRGPAFGGDLRSVLDAIRARGFEPAVWVAPFIAEPGSRLFRDHPDWFVRDERGAPLASDRVTFGGWRRGPWYALDGTHAEAQAHLEHLFRTMRQEWGCTYFKLDATFWGAIHGGRFHDREATRIEAYRRGMEAVRRGAGDAFLLGCNHPIWPSLGLVHGSRSSNDVKRSWARVRGTARENLMRSWQHGRLWWNDPDAAVLSGGLSPDERLFHATALFATGGMVLSGDDLTVAGPDVRAKLRALLPPSGAAARFTDESFTVGTVDLPGKRAVCLLNWDEAPRTLSFQLPGPHRIVDLWAGQSHPGLEAGRITVTLPARSGRVLLCTPEPRTRVVFDVAAFDRDRVLRAAERTLREQPFTITASLAPRSAGGPHDYYSEADYWWPDPQNPEGPYVQRDGMSNPDNFVDHRRHLMRLSVQVPALAAAWTMTRDGRYAAHAAKHLRAWFLDDPTRMSPHLRYAQAIRGRVTGRGTGIIDTLHLVEVALAILALDEAAVLSAEERRRLEAWFSEYLRFLTAHAYGIEERDAKNNHATCWLLQAAAFARLTRDEERLANCRHRFKCVLVPGQMAADGSFPREMGRSKPYGYSLFNLEAMAALAQLLSTAEDDLWSFALPDGRGMRQAMAFMTPYLRDKKRWPLPPDVMYDAHWPMRQSSLLFAGLAFGREDYVELWKTLPADSEVYEVIRNFFVRQPLLWVTR